MELIIYGTFLALSLLAYGARREANKGDEKKISISNINFKRFYFKVMFNFTFLLFQFPEEFLPCVFPSSAG